MFAFQCAEAEAEQEKALPLRCCLVLEGRSRRLELDIIMLVSSNSPVCCGSLQLKVLQSSSDKYSRFFLRSSKYCQHAGLVTFSN